jgi:hypothetical protein
MDGSLSVPVEYIRMAGKPLVDLQISRQVRVMCVALDLHGSTGSHLIALHWQPPSTNLLQSWRVPQAGAVSQLIPSLMSSPTPSRVLRFEWYECWPAIHHNFVALQVGRTEDNIWLRIDRVGNTDQVSMRCLVLKLCLSIRYLIVPDF